MKDSPNGKRYGRRDRQGRIIEAYGFDLSPLFTRMAEFQAVAAKGKALRERMRHLRRRSTIARNGQLQILDTAAEQGLNDATWQTLEREGRALAKVLRTVEMPDEMEIGVASLERRQREARERLEIQLAAAAGPAPESADSDPKEPENRPHQYSYKTSSNPQEDTVVAFEESKSGGSSADLHPSPPAKPREGQKGQGGKDGAHRQWHGATDQPGRAGAPGPTPAAFPADIFAILARYRRGRGLAAARTQCLQAALG
jgi:replication initiation protein RepC